MAYSPRLEPRGVGALLDATCRLYGADLWPVLALSLLFTGPALLLAALLPDVPMLNDVLSLLSTSCLAGAVTILVSERVLGRPVSVRSAVARTLSFLPALTAAQFWSALMILLGILMLVIPGLVWTVQLWFVVPAVALEGKGVRASLTRSRQLARYDRKHVFLTVFCVAGMYLTLFFGASLAWAQACSYFWRSPVGQDWGASLATVVLGPFYSISTVLLYYDIRIRYEGFDLEVLGAEMEARR